MLDALEDWFRANTAQLKDRGLQVTLTRPSQPSDNNGIYADLGTSQYVARVTVWQSGHCDREALHISTGDTVFWDHCLLRTPADLHQLLDEFCTRLTDPATQP